MTKPVISGLTGLSIEESGYIQQREQLETLRGIEQSLRHQQIMEGHGSQREMDPQVGRLVELQQETGQQFNELIDAQQELAHVVTRIGEQADYRAQIALENAQLGNTFLYGLGRQ